MLILPEQFSISYIYPAGGFLSIPELEPIHETY